MQKSDQELLPGRRRAGRLGLHLVSSPQLSLGLGIDKEEPAGLGGGDTGLLVSSCRALSLVPWGHLCPLHLLWDEGLEYRSLPIPDKTFPANQDSLDHACPFTVSGCPAHVGRGGHIPEHYLIHLAEGISASATKQLSVSFIQRGPWLPTVPSRVSCLLSHRPVAAWAVPIAHRLVERGGQAGGSWSPGKRGW